MGLDMYLERRKYFGLNFPHVREEYQKKGVDIPDLSKLGINVNRLTHVTEQCIYWRKANAIHQWFVDNVQDGNDDCKDYYVSREKLKELLTTIMTVLRSKGTPAEKSVALEHLPPQEGFFFGSTDIDKWYWEDLERTVEEIKKCLDEDKDGKHSLYYTSSW